MLFNNDRVSHWCVGALFSWAMIFCFWGIPIFHLWLGVPLTKISTFTGIACALQLAVTPWLFSARATRQDPTGRTIRRSAAVVVWLSLTAVLFAYFVQFGQPKNLELRAILFGTPTVAGAAALIIIGVVARQNRDSAKG